MANSIISRGEILLMNSSTFGEFLKDTYDTPQEALDKLKAHDIGGEEFFNLVEKDFTDLDMKIGHKKKLQKLIALYGAETLIYTIGDDGILARPISAAATPISCGEYGTSLGSTSVSDFVQLTSPSCSYSSNVIHLSRNTEPCPIGHGQVMSTPIKSNAKQLEFKLRECLSGHPKGPQILDLLDEGKPLVGKPRRTFVNIMCSHLVQLVGGFYPSTKQKEDLAIAIVTEFPCLRARRPGLKGHEHYFSPTSCTKNGVEKKGGSGFIQYKLNSMIQKISPCKKKNRPQIARKLIPTAEETVEVDLDDGEINAMKTWMHYTPASAMHMEQMKEYLRSTQSHRREYIKKDEPSITEILVEYPRFLDFNGLLIEYEFSTWKNDDYNGHLKLLEFLPKVNKYGTVQKLESKIECNDDCLQGLDLLLQLLPNSSFNHRKRKSAEVQKAPKLNYIVKLLKDGEDVENAAKNKSDGILQPYLLCVVRKRQLVKIFIVLDHQFLDVGNSSDKAFDILFKCYYVFNVRYPETVQTFYEFIQIFLYNMTENVNVRATSEVLYSAVDAVTL